MVSFLVFFKRPSPDPDDQSLIAGTLDGDLQQFDVLVTRYRNQAYRFILKHIHDPVRAEDLTQDTFLSAYQKLDSFRGHSKFSTWLLGIAFNKVRNEINRAIERRYDIVSDEVLNTHEAPNQNPMEAVDKLLTSQKLREAINRLPQDLQEVLIAVSLEGLSYEEAAEIMAIPIGTVKSKLFRARMALKEVLGDFQGTA